MYKFECPRCGNFDQRLFDRVSWHELPDEHSRVLVEEYIYCKVCSHTFMHRERFEPHGGVEQV